MGAKALILRSTASHLGSRLQNPPHLSTKSRVPDAPLQYKFQHGMINGSRWRPPSAAEREKLLGFRAGHTDVIMTLAQAKGRDEEREDRRLCLLGNSIQTGVLAWIIGWLCFVRHAFSCVWQALRVALRSIK